MQLIVTIATIVIMRKNSQCYGNGQLQATLVFA